MKQLHLEFEDIFRDVIYNDRYKDVEIGNYLETYSHDDCFYSEDYEEDFENTIDFLWNEVWHILEDIFHIDISDLDILDLEYPCDYKDYTITLGEIRKSFLETQDKISKLLEVK